MVAASIPSAGSGPATGEQRINITSANTEAKANCAPLFGLMLLATSVKTVWSKALEGCVGVGIAISVTGGFRAFAALSGGYETMSADRMLTTMMRH